jgi:hypothetical protein
MILCCGALRTASIVSGTVGNCRTQGPGREAAVKNCDNRVSQCRCGPAVECLLGVLVFVDGRRGKNCWIPLGMKLRLGFNNFDAVSNQFSIVDNSCPELRNCVCEMFFDRGPENQDVLRQYAILKNVKSPNFLVGLVICNLLLGGKVLPMAALIASFPQLQELCCHKFNQRDDPALGLFDQAKAFGIVILYSAPLFS